MKHNGIQKGVLGTLPNGVSPYANNIRIDKASGTIVEEEGLKIIYDMDINPIGRIATTYDIILFGRLGSKSGIWIINEGRFDTILLSDYLNFSVGSPIEGDFTFDEYGNIIIVWRDADNPVRYLNIGNNSLVLDVNKEFVNPNQVKLLNLFPIVSTPNFTLQPFDFGGLRSGAYQVAIAYVNGNDITNYVAISNWITVTSREKNTGFNNYDGDETGLRTKKAINILITDLDTAYTKINVAVIKKVKGIVTAHDLGNYQYDGNRLLTITGDETWTDIAIEDVIVGTETYYTAKTIIQIQERLALGNLTKLPIADYQKYANNIKIGWVRETDVELTKISNSYRDEVIIFDKRGFKTNEVKAFYIVLRMIDGTYSKAFHIPNTQALNAFVIGGTTYGGNTAINTLPVNINTQPLIDIAPTHRINQILNNATDFGRMGIWLNEDEVYPNTDAYDIFDATGQIGTLRGTQVKHYRFPSISQLETWGNPYVTSGPNVDAGNILVLVGGDVPNGTDEYMIIDDPIDIDSGGTFDGESYNYTFQRTGTFNLKVWFDGNNVLSGDTAIFTVILTNGAGTNALYRKEETGNAGGKDIEFRYSATLAIKAGDKLKIYGNVTANLIGTGWAYTGHILGSNFMVIEDATLESLDVKSKILGIKVSDVYIPPAIAQYVDKWEIYYAESTIDNSLVLSQALIKRFSGGEIRAYGWDLLYNKPATLPVYLHTHLGYTFNTNTNLLVHNTHTITEQLNAITYNEYYPANVGLGEEERMKMEVLTFNSTSASDYYLVDMMLVKRNVFTDVFNQNLIATGKSFSAATTLVNALYGGDIFVSAFGWRIKADYLTDSQRFGGGTWTPPIAGASPFNYAVLVFAHETAANVGMRYYDEILKVKYALKHLVMDDVDGVQGMSYEPTYNSINDTIKLIGYWKSRAGDIEVVNYPYRVIRSAVRGSESNVFNWRKFKANDYYDMPRNKGVVWKLNVLRDTLIIHTEYSFYLAYMKDRLVTEIIEVYLGQGDIFDRKPEEPISVVEGYAGCNSQWSSIITPHGELFVDTARKNIWLFDGKLTDIGRPIQEWLNIMMTNEYDNPFQRQGVTCGYDYDYNRALVTFANLNFMWTLSYDFDTKLWASYHSYTPNVYITLYQKLWSINKPSLVIRGTMGTHNEKGSILHHTGNKTNSYIDILFKYKERVELHSLDWEALIKSVNTGDINTGSEGFVSTIKQILVYTANQTTGIVDVSTLQGFRVISFNSRSKGNVGSISALSDKLIDKTVFPIDNLGSLKSNILLVNKAWFKNAMMVNDYFVVRIVFNNTINKQTYLTEITPLVTKSKR